MPKSKILLLISMMFGVVGINFESSFLIYLIRFNPSGSWSRLYSTLPLESVRLLQAKFSYSTVQRISLELSKQCQCKNHFVLVIKKMHGLLLLNSPF